MTQLEETVSRGLGGGGIGGSRAELQDWRSLHVLDGHPACQRLPEPRSSSPALRERLWTSIAVRFCQAEEAECGCSPRVAFREDLDEASGRLLSRSGVVSSVAAQMAGGGGRLSAPEYRDSNQDIAILRPR